MDRLRKLFLVGLLFALLTMVAACGGGNGGGNGGEGGDTGTGGGDTGGGDLGSLTLEMGSILPQTGDLAQFGPEMQQGVDLAVQQINACDAMTVNMTAEDSGTTEQTAATAADKLINTDNASAILGAAGSAVSFAVVDPAAQNEVVQISPASTSPDFTDYEDNGYFFRTVPSDALQGVILAQVAQEAGYETVNIIALDNDYGLGIAETFEENFEGEVAESLAYNPTGTSFDSEVEQVASGNPDAILVIAYPETGTIVMQAAQEQGLVGETPFLFTDGLADPEFPESTGVDLIGQQGTRPASEGPGAEDFASAYDEEFGGEPGTFSANSYDGVMLAALAAAAASDTSGSAIQENLQAVSEGGTEVTGADICSGLESAAAGEDVNYEGAAGSQNFDDNGDVSSDYELWEFADGELSQVEIFPAPESQ